MLFAEHGWTVQDYLLLTGAIGGSILTPIIAAYLAVVKLRIEAKKDLDAIENAAWEREREANRKLKAQDEKLSTVTEKVDHTIRQNEAIMTATEKVNGGASVAEEVHEIHEVVVPPDPPK